MAAKRRISSRQRGKVEHSVDAFLYQDFALTLEGSALELVIRSGGRKLGTLGLGRGSITWKGRRDKSALPLGWRQFIALMEHERRERVPRR